MFSDFFRKMLESDHTLTDVLEFREQTYAFLTQEAVRLFGRNLTDSVNMYLNSNSIIEWNTVELMPTLDGFVRVMGLTTPSIGAIIDVNGSKITIDENNVTQYKQIIRFVLPIHLLESGSINEMYSFIKDLSSIATVASEKDIEVILKDYYSSNSTKLTLSDFYNRILDKQTRPTKIMDFDVSGLTDEQIASIFSYMPCKTETIN